MLKAETAVESSWGTSRIWDKATWHQDNDKNRECCNTKGQSTSNYELSWFRKMRANMWYLEGGIEGRKRKERRKVAQAWESFAFQENQRENASLHWLLYLSKQHLYPHCFLFTSFCYMQACIKCCEIQDFMQVRTSKCLALQRHREPAHSHLGALSSLQRVASLMLF